VTQPPETEPPEPELHGVRALVTGGTSDPAIMGPPVVWLASRASDGQTDQRIVAREFAASPPA